MRAIQVKDLKKTFETRRKTAGFAGSLRAMFRPEKIPVHAVRGITFEMEPGELVGRSLDGIARCGHW